MSKKSKVKDHSGSEEGKLNSRQRRKMEAMAHQAERDKPYIPPVRKKRTKEEEMAMTMLLGLASMGQQIDRHVLRKI